MKTTLKTILGLSAIAMAAQVAAQATLYEGENFGGRNFTTDERVGNMERFGFNDSVSSISIAGHRWEVCDGTRFEGRCTVLRPGRYPSLATMGMNNRISSLRMIRDNENVADNRYAPLPVVASVTFYEREQFGGRSFTTRERVPSFETVGFNDRASSAEVVGTSWQVCDDMQYGGRCVVLPPGRYPSLSAMGLNNSISSVQDLRVSGSGALTPYDARRRGNERLYEVPVTSVKAVVGPPEQRCWVEREQVPQEQRRTNVGGAIAGAVIGGILGHQVGDGRGKDLATIGGVVGGGLLGANVGRGNSQPATQDVQRCTTVQSRTAPTLWDVTYTFGGQEHRIQMSMDPGATVIVNERGEPRAKS